MKRIETIGWNPTWKAETLRALGVRWRNAILRVGGAPGNLVAANITGASGGQFADPAGNQFNLLAPGSGVLEQVPFRVRAAGWVNIPAGTFTATLVAALYGVAGAAAWTAASGNKIAASTSLSITQAGTVAVVIPFEIDVLCEGDTTSGKLQGAMAALVNNISTALVVLTNAPTSVNFQTEPPLQFAVGVTLSNAQATAVSHLGTLYLEAA